MSEMIPSNPIANVEDLFAPEASDSNDLSQGVSAGFSVMSIRGSKWRIKHGGEETPITDANDEPVPSVQVVLVKASPAVSKIYYAKKFTEGDSEEPDCWSVDGEKPDASCHNRQAETCAMCPHNVWGSRMTDSGKKAKACADNRRVAVVPAEDIANDVYGGPMLLRVPAASLADLSTYGKKLSAMGHHYRGVVTRLGFDMDAAYPKLTFKAVRPLSQEEKAAVAAHFQTGRLDGILSASADIPAGDVAPKPAAKPAAQTVDVEFEEPAPQETIFEKPEKKVEKKATKKTNGKAKAAKEPEPAPVADKLEDDLDDILSDLDGLS